MVEKTLKGVAQCVACLVPLLTKLRLGKPFAGKFAGVESDKYRRFPISPDDDCRFVLDVGDDHGVIVTAPGLACYVDRW